MLFMWMHLTLDRNNHAQDYTQHWEYYCTVYFTAKDTRKSTQNKP